MIYNLRIKKYKLRTEKNLKLIHGGICGWNQKSKIKNKKRRDFL